MNGYFFTDIATHLFLTLNKNIKNYLSWYVTKVKDKVLLRMVFDISLPYIHYTKSKKS